MTGSDDNFVYTNKQQKNNNVVRYFFACFSRHSTICDRSAKFGMRVDVSGSSAFVMGDVVWDVSHSEIVARSYVWLGKQNSNNDNNNDNDNR